MVITGNNWLPPCALDQSPAAQKTHMAVEKPMIMMEQIEEYKQTD